MFLNIFFARLFIWTRPQGRLAFNFANRLVRKNSRIVMRKSTQLFFVGKLRSTLAATGTAIGMCVIALPALSGEVGLPLPRQQVSLGADQLDKLENSISKQALQAKLAFCEECHGSSAQGFRGYYPIPRLAGQQTEYLQNQLRAFVEQRRTNNIMFHVSRVLSPAMIAALATNFHGLNPKPLRGGPKELVARGKEIYETGIPDKNVPACFSCHGFDAKGNGQFPRLAGQLFDYISNKLTNWDKERGQHSGDPDTSTVMQPIVRSLTDSQIKAVASYLSELE